jgi:hypothetical protein
VSVEVLQDPRCIEMMRAFIAEQPRCGTRTLVCRPALTAANGPRQAARVHIRIAIAAGLVALSTLSLSGTGRQENPSDIASA